MSSAAKNIENLQLQAQKASKSAQAAASQTGIARHSKIFQDEARKNNYSRFWLIATVLLIIFTLLWGIL